MDTIKGPIRNKKILTGLNSDSYEHPFDHEALNKLESIPFLAKATKWVVENTVERVYTIQYTGSNLKVTPENYPKIYSYLEYACQILDIKSIPDLYIEWNYGINAFTVGAQNPIIVIQSGLIDLCDDDEIMFIIAHECGHIKSEHMMYHMLADIINIVISAIPGGELFGGGIQYALLYWRRMSEFTADRAGLLGCQNPDAAIRVMMKMSGLPKSEYSEMKYGTFIKQAQEFKMLDLSAMNKFVKIIAISDDTHPWTVMRAAEILNWVNDGMYNNILK